MGETYNEDTWNHIKRIYSAHINKNVKFLQEDEANFHSPDFITGKNDDGLSSQAVKICSLILKHLGKPNATSNEKIYFWIGYGNLIRNEHLRLRRYENQAIGKSVVKCKYLYQNSDFFPNFLIKNQPHVTLIKKLQI